ncbi:F-type H+-transporting ATPase subunit epsilon [Breoghania corrubedonensis]|uniref:ATP synthase epsilon chain n=1 Tax=Breoghania corrubedonensis TaxID=665038 RepID=A0A2T5VBF0_9HYPH|nr:F0F1 ATP synthase subunit epsilon [Breoghania corrubedonensis]PTW61086.1 F-type H+-transporting ATPase subunit epsilon [Breoghania corrubedonensis]
MRLSIVTPLQVAVDEPDVLSVRAEDNSGSFGILPGHADFLTSLAISIVRWQRRDASSGLCAVRGGVMTVASGSEISIATREAVVGTDLATLDEVVLERFHGELDEERTQNVEATRLHLDMIRRLVARAGVASGADAM